ncbi:hypothetical protein DFJ77DRAFT_482153, partial [Powellomyces hirtus]
MPPVPVSRVFTEPRRPQRRHYVDLEYVYPYETARAEDGVGAVVVQTGRRHPISVKQDHETGVSTYAVDYAASTHDTTKPDLERAALPPRMTRPRGGAASSGEAMYARSLRDGAYADAHHHLRALQKAAAQSAYVSSYQAACRDAAELELELALPDIVAPRLAATPPPKSLYQASFADAGTAHAAAAAWGGRTNAWGKTKALYVPKSKGTIRDVLSSFGATTTSPTAGGVTSYQSDFQQWPVFDSDPGPPRPREPMSTRAACRTVVPRAFKYRRWGEGFAAAS